MSSLTLMTGRSILLCFLWPPSVYIVPIIVSSNCIASCFLTISGSIYGIFNITFPLGIIVLSNTALFSQGIYAKLSHHHVIRWRRL
jgi:ABC-type multidrug transport system permease subunit